METVYLFDFKIHNVNLTEALDNIDALIRKGGTHLVVTLGVEMIMHGETDREFKEIVNSASLVVPDSIGVLWGCRQKGIILKERVPGVDIIYATAKQWQKYPWKVFFLGAKPGIARQAGEKLRQKYPAFNLVGEHHGYFKPGEEEEEIVRKIISSGTQLLLIGMGFPFQEKWFVKNRDKFKNIVSMGVGGSFDVLSETVKRAPAIFQKTGLEWFYRLIIQPSRIPRMTALPRFMLKVMTTKG